jgi:DNA-binding NarL/FixJ family response regulator
MISTVVTRGDVAAMPESAADQKADPIRVLLVDDHLLVRSGLAALVEAEADMTVVGSAADGAQALDLVTEVAPDVVLMDLSMPVLDGVAATRRLTAEHPEVAVLVLTSFADRDRVTDALDAGAMGYVLKDTEPTALLEALRAVGRGESPIDPRVARTLLTSRRHTGPATPLTEREQEVLALVGRGLPNKQIARTLGIRESTVKAHLTSVFAAIGVRDRTSAALWAQRNLPSH